MKTLINILLLNLAFVFSSHAQLIGDIFGFNAYQLSPRGVQFKFFNEAQKMLYVDYREGLLLDCTAIKDADSPTDETKKYSLPFWLGKHWILQDSVPFDLVYIPEGQTLDNWDEMITIQRFDAQGLKPAKLYAELQKFREEHCPGKSHFNILSSEKNRIIYFANSEQCAEFEAQTALSSIIAPPVLTIGQYTVWRVEYTIMGNYSGNIFSEEAITWFEKMELLSGKKLNTFLDEN